MSSPSSKKTSGNCPEFAVRRETISAYFSPPLASSTFYDLVNKGRITPMKGLKGYYCLNDSLRRLGLREVPSLPDARRRSGEDIVRLAFTVIDPEAFPAPPWMLSEEPLDARDVDAGLRIAEHCRADVEALESPLLKTHYMAGVLDAEFVRELVMREKLG